jgi:hypothetical protein
VNSSDVIQINDIFARIAGFIQHNIYTKYSGLNDPHVVAGIRWDILSTDIRRKHLFLEWDIYDRSKDCRSLYRMSRDMAVVVEVSGTPFERRQPVFRQQISVMDDADDDG